MRAHERDEVGLEGLRLDQDLLDRIAEANHAVDGNAGQVMLDAVQVIERLGRQPLHLLIRIRDRASINTPPSLRTRGHTNDTDRRPTLPAAPPPPRTHPPPPS